MFGRATIRLGNGPHSSSLLFLWPPCVADADTIFMDALCNRAGHYILPCGFLWPPYVIGQTIIMVALCNRADHYIFILFLSSSSFFFLLLFFSSPNLSGRRLDVYHTLAHGVALVRI